MDKKFVHMIASFLITYHKQTITIKHVNTIQQITDMFTKLLDKMPFETNLCAALPGVREFRLHESSP